MKSTRLPLLDARGKVLLGLALLALILFVLTHPSLAQTPKGPVVSAPVPAPAEAPKGLSEVSALKLQNLLLREQVVKLSSQVDSLTAEVTALRAAPGQKAAEQVQAEQNSLAKEICKEAGVPDQSCPSWLNAQLQRSSTPPGPVIPKQ